MAYWEPEGYHQLGQGEYAGITAEEVLERMKEATGTTTMLELANWLASVLPSQVLAQLALALLR